MLLDFMTKDGELHPVWYDETTKWNVFLGRCIQGEVRIRHLGRKNGYGDEKSDGGGSGEYHSRTGSSKMERFLEIAQSYDCNMNLYTNNCRIFCARMEREVYRLNNGGGSELPERTAANPMRPSDLRFATRVALAALLPALYPGIVLLLCWAGLREL